MSLVAASRSSDSSRSRLSSLFSRTSFVSAFWGEVRSDFDRGFLVGILHPGNPKLEFRNPKQTSKMPNPKHQIQNKRSQKHFKFGKSKTRNPKRLVLNLVLIL